MEAITYVAAAALTLAVVAFMLRLWRAAWDIPFFYTGDAVSVGAHVKATLEWGWYESQPDLGAPYGQHFNDFPFSDNFHLVVIRGLGYVTSSWPVAFNVYYVAAFVFCAWGALWFLRREGIGRVLSVVLAVLFAVAPYHFLRNENHYFLAAYWTVPLILVLVMDALRGQPLWSRNHRVSGPLGYLCGRGAAYAVVLVVVASTTAYYAVFGALLLAAAGLVGLARNRSWRRLGGVVAAGALLTAALFANLLPDLLYQRSMGVASTALVRPAGDAENWALKLTSLLLPAPEHPIAAFAAFRAEYDATRPLSGEEPALGTICAVALAAVVVIALGRIAWRAERPGSPETVARRRGIADLSFVTMTALLLSTIGGLGSLLSFVTDAIRGWNRMSIFIALLMLAVVGIAGQGAVQWTRRRLATRAPSGVLRLLTPVAAALLLLVGVYDQQTKGSVPPYAQSAQMWNSDEAFVRQLTATVPPGSMMFQLPYMVFPEAGPAYDAGDADLTKLSLHTTQLRWSLGGLKGRPQTDWPYLVSQKPPSQVVDTVTRMGFTGIVVDRWATKDRGAELEAAYAPITGAPQLVSPDGRWAYLSLAPQLAQVNASTTPGERQAFQAQILSGKI